ncbi:MAG: sugar transporter metabolite:H+ symporter, partial [Modestobacter sp.]|nr:sugar transporter metabolite:H+ symporter [Modestobacter sp.]
FYGYLLGAGVMVAGGLIAAFLGVSAEGKSLEDVASPLAARNAQVRRPGTRAEGAARPH